jgi:hypothetical protein
MAVLHDSLHDDAANCGRRVEMDRVIDSRVNAQALWRAQMLRGEDENLGYTPQNSTRTI